ncbi:Uncharacterized conserved protein YlxW, UPF0749 family [Micromonospora pattaloongensis]|uniref:Uncharacterized conserved protein YlxW, UPF0749 family n=1 Tax=Micromonospora pattaloongensis TaxID=405436 RepID=A0A1H3P1V8_9ACTN|nr:DUF881 domain-containing protein [Micromonospora pattaloongensis]SDY95092.1 Uncharacterized conserved protein YlxW, UPF0749 family [Micromonospora pattaloongensis]
MSTPGPGGPERGRTFAPDFLTELFRNPLEPGYADAAARRQRTGPATGWRAVVPRTATVITLVVVGFLLVIAYRQTLAEAPSRSQARAGLVGQIKQRESLTDQLQQRADGLRVEVARQRDAALTDTDAARLRDLEASTGLARVRGDGVVVRVGDAPAQVDSVTGEAQANDLGRVLDRDLQDIANGLWSAGAEAIAINGQRLTATTTIRAAGRAILVDFRPVTGPYEVTAIGPEQMERRFKDSAAAKLMRQLVAEHGMSFGVRAVDDITLAAAGQPQLRYARPSPPPAPTPSGPGPSTSPSSSPDAGPSSSPPGGGR